jgi:4-amino-4-deoxy-L-arabinose transferase-like glycosyltransferase
MTRYRNLWLLFAVFGLAAIVDIVIASRSGLWPDELFSLALATGHSLEHPAAIADAKLGDFIEPDHPVPATEFRRFLKHDDPPASPARVIRAVLLSDTNPPLYYVLLYYWTLVFGTSDLGLRLFSMVCSLACLPLLVSIVRRIAGEGGVFASCVLFAFSPLAIYYSTEGRMYSLLWLCVLGTMWASLVMQERGGGTGIYVVWIVSSAAGFLSHYFFVFPWLAFVTYLLIKPGKLARAHLGACVLLIAALILPWYLSLPRSVGSWRITKDWLKWQPKGFDRLTALRDLVLQFFSSRSKLWPDHPISGITALVLFSLVGGAMVWKLGIHVFDQQRLVLWLLFAAACTGPIVFDLVQHTYTVAVPRYAIAALPGAYLLAAVGLACLDHRVRLIILVLILLAWVPAIFNIYRIRLPSLPMREIAHAASVNNSPSDLILVHSIPSGVLGIARYAAGPAPLASWVGQLGNRRVPESVRTLATGRTRIRFVEVHGVREPTPEENWLRANAVVCHEMRLGSGRIVDFQPVNSETF